MRGGVVAMVMTLVMVLGAAGVASARGGHELSDDGLEIEMARNRALASYIRWNGRPDLAESRELADRPPWDDHEVTLYYLGARKEISFARAFILGQPTIHVERYERPLSDADVAALAKRVKPRKGGASPSAPPAPAPGMGPSAAASPAPGTASAAATPPQSGAAPGAGAAPAVAAAPVDRAETAAHRAEIAAAQLEAAAEKAESAADRAEAVSTAMETAVRTAWK